MLAQSAVQSPHFPSGINWLEQFPQKAAPQTVQLRSLVVKV